MGSVSFVIAFGKLRQSLWNYCCNNFEQWYSTEIHFGLRVFHLGWIIAVIAAFSEMKSCSCGDGNTHINDSFYVRNGLFPYMVILLVLVSIFIVSRRVIGCLIRNVHVTQKSQLILMTIYDKKRMEEYDSYQ